MRDRTCNCLLQGTMQVLTTLTQTPLPFQTSSKNPACHFCLFCKKGMAGMLAFELVCIDCPGSCREKRRPTQISGMAATDSLSLPRVGLGLLRYSLRGLTYVRIVNSTAFEAGNLLSVWRSHLTNNLYISYDCHQCNTLTHFIGYQSM